MKSESEFLVGGFGFFKAGLGEGSGGDELLDGFADLVFVEGAASDVLEARANGFGERFGETLDVE